VPEAVRALGRRKADEERAVGGRAEAPGPWDAASDRATEAPGAGRALAAVYAVLALAAGSRALVQLALDPGRAPLAYGLSAVSAAIYLVGAVALRRPGPGPRRVAVRVCAVELAGVLAVGTASVALPDAFPDASVWSGYGSGYGWLPLVLPALGLAYLRRAGDQRT
jgi:hypothetical protein